MYWQKEYVREGVAMTLNETYRLELPRSGDLSALLLRISGAEVSGYGASGGDWRIIDKISKIEVIANGAEIIKSITGIQAQALAYYDQKVTAPDKWRNYATNTQFCYVLINFGRYLGDPQMWLPLSRFADVELRVTNTATAASHFSDLTISALGIYGRDNLGAVPLGYLRTEEWRKWTTVQNATEYLELPTQYMIRRIMLRAFPALDGNNIDDTNLTNLMDDIDYSFKAGQERVYKGGLDDLIYCNYFQGMAPVITGGYAMHTADKGIDIGQGQSLFGAWGAGSQDGAGAAVIATLETARNGPAWKPETSEADSPIGFISYGTAYHCTTMLHHDYSPDPSSWLDPSPNGKGVVKLDIHTRDSSSADNGTNSVVLDRLVRF